jgi:hypothetical protein
MLQTQTHANYSNTTIFQGTLVQLLGEFGIVQLVDLVEWSPSMAQGYVNLQSDRAGNMYALAYGPPAGINNAAVSIANHTQPNIFPPWPQNYAQSKDQLYLSALVPGQSCGATSAYSVFTYSRAPQVGPHDPAPPAMFIVETIVNNSSNDEQEEGAAEVAWN